MPASILPRFPRGGLPSAESPGRRRAIQATALAAIAVSLAYLVWRALYTVDLSAWWVSIPLLLVEIYAVFGLSLFAFSLWDVDRRPLVAGLKKGEQPGHIAVLIPTYNESAEILIPTIAAAVGLQLAHETWVLDDGSRPEVEQLAGLLGAKYLARSDRAGAKAGNINNALTVIEADFIGVLDADHAAAPGFLRKTLGYFRDPRVALVQTPQEFYNLDSFEHDDSDEANEGYHEQRLFYRIIQPGKNRWDAAFWCGTGAVVRVAALRDVGGVATDTITEDIHTTIKLHRRGWKTVYHNEVLARGLAADTAQQFQLQRLRWGTGAMQVLRRENPLFVSGLSFTQRVAYAATLLGWFEAWRTLGYLLLPIAVLFSGGVPIRAQPLTFALAFGVTFALQQVALRLLSRGYHRLYLTTVFELVRMTPNIAATLTLIRPAKMRFRVTPKGREAEGHERQRPPFLLVALACLSVVAASWFVLTEAGLTPLHYERPWFAYGAAFWLAVNFCLIIAAIHRISSLRYAAQRRAAARFQVGLPATLDGRPCLIHEISLTGAQISFEASSPQQLAAGRHGLTIGMPGSALSLGAEARWQRVDKRGRALTGVEFTPGQTETQARLALAILNRQLTPRRGGLVSEPKAA